MRNKKAIANYTIIVWSWLIFTALTLFFFLLFGISLRGCGDKTAVQEIKGDSTDEVLAELTLLNYLRTPIEVDKESVTISDLLLKSIGETCTVYTKGAFKGDPNAPCEKEEGTTYFSETLVEESKNIFDNFFGSDLWYVGVIHPNFKEGSPTSLVQAQQNFNSAVFPFTKKRNSPDIGLLQRCKLKYGVEGTPTLATVSIYYTKATNTTLPDKNQKIMNVMLAFCRIPQK